MKKTAFVTALLIASSVHGEEGSTWQTTCKRFADIAEQIMQYRQEGVPADNLIDIASDSQLMQDVVIAAYERPRYQTEGMKASAVSDFKNAVYIDCANAYRKAKK